MILNLQNSEDASFFPLDSELFSKGLPCLWGGGVEEEGLEAQCSIMLTVLSAHWPAKVTLQCHPAAQVTWHYFTFKSASCKEP